MIGDSEEEEKEDSKRATTHTPQKEREGKGSGQVGSGRQKETLRLPSFFASLSSCAASRTLLKNPFDLSRCFSHLTLSLFPQFGCCHPRSTMLRPAHIPVDMNLAWPSLLDGSFWSAIEQYVEMSCTSIEAVCYLGPCSQNSFAFCDKMVTQLTRRWWHIRLHKYSWVDKVEFVTRLVPLC
mgnify:CR=1 FL=1